ncbi:hypothetical protein LIP_1793 [Limnochorda pilosa]|uniref:Segregation and condensation protein A n=1 Tax=Limnochorda pilosa TaxID=1555112 RepID=A0A0K2SKU4_LIMPI|nr:hypothetical protein LIP_1793 [Limnochorda pilosa]
MRLALFEGSLGALLEMLRAGEISPEEVPLAFIGREYVTYLRAAAAPEPDREGEALLAFAMLIWVKLHRLLPGEPEPAEELDEAMVRELLEEHQNLYRRFQQLSEWLALQGASAARAWPRPPVAAPPAAEDGAAPESDLEGPLDPQLLAEGLRRVLARLPRHVDPPLQEIDWEGILRRVRRHLAPGRRLRFEELIGGAGRREVIASFLAVLELVRLGEARVWQEELFGPIFVAGVAGPGVRP